MGHRRPDCSVRHAFTLVVVSASESASVVHRAMLLQGQICCIVTTTSLVCRKKNKRPEIPAQKQTQPIQASNDHVASRCNLCFMSGKRNKEITLSVGSLAYLALPARGSLVPGHCTIIPVDHVASMRAADSEVVEEVKNFKKCLIQMFQAQVCYSYIHILLVAP